MAITKFTDDTGIIQGLSDKPNEIEGLTADQLKKKFDDNAINLKAYLNETLTAEVDTKFTDTETTLNGKTPSNGWISAEETWTYSSVDNPTGVIVISGDVTTKYSLGMRIKFTNGGNTIYGKISKTPTYSSPNTTLTFLHEINPSTYQALYLIQDSAITNNYYSSMKVPYGFPQESNKWSLVYSTAVSSTQSTPTIDVWYNKGGSLSIPIGSWKIEFAVRGYTVRGTATFADFNITLSTANNSESDSVTTRRLTIPTITDLIGDVQSSMPLDLTTKSTRYVNICTHYANTTSIAILQVYLIATCTL